MKKVEVVKASEVEVTPFVLQDFTQYKAENYSMKKVSKKELRSLAENIGLVYDDTQIVFTKKLITAYLNR